MNPLFTSKLAGIFLAPVLALATAASGNVSATASASTAPSASLPPVCITLSHNLMLGSRDRWTGGDVSALQSFLIQEGYLYTSATGYFGILTQRSVQQFQSSQGIFATGYVGALTRAAISSADCGGNPPPSSGLFIRSLSPASGAIGSTITIFGDGFTQDNTVVFGGGSIMHVASYDGTTLTFAVPSSLNPPCFYSQPQCLIASRQTTPGTYAVSVSNGAGSTNAVSFTVTAPVQTSNVRIYSITPSSGPVGTTVSITGFGFASSNAIRFGGGAIYNVPITSSIAIACTTNPSCHGGINQTLTFTVPNSLGAYCVAGMACPMYAMLVTPGTYNVSVTNDSGTSDPVAFTVTAGSAIPQSGPSISGIDAPASLSIGTMGVWTVHAGVQSGSTANLHYSVDWGDQVSAASGIIAPQPTQMQSSAAFTHSYSRSGAYTAVFTVTDDSGNAATVKSTVTVTPLY